ncbi:hypothetical protein Ddye_008296 [Dipteronia dyeriana]|uniref:Uncharacterized protein n=1 Tax=Dipteronia dyeriana TaxID=168575 RepID=A0AAD9X9E8_9ROSI|nr:hypothetical protein Ddye_008296 [Dipteronia dyeriana]
MDTSNPAVYVNGGLLRMYVGRRVRAVIQAIQPDAGGVTGKSTDDHQLVVKDTQNYNQFCQLANGEFKHLFI